MTDPDPTALRCTSCAAALPIPQVASVRCHNCGEVTRIDGALLEAIHAHGGRVQGYRRQSHQATEHAVMARMTRQYGGGWSVAFVVSWLAAGVMLMIRSPIAYVAAAVIFLAPFFAVAWYGKRTERRLREQAVAEREVEALVHVACPTCGGQNELRPDAAVRPCGFCAGALVADEAARAELIAVARSSAEQERWRAMHQGWQTAAHTRRDPRTDLVPYFVIGGLGSLWVVGTLVASVRVAFGFEPESGLAGLVAMQVVSIAIVVGVGTPLWIRRARARAWSRALQSLARRTGGTVDRTPGALVRWIIAHWRADFSSTSLGSGREYGVVASSVVPLWALSAAPLALRPGPVRRHLRLVVPGDADGALVQRLARGVQALGFELHRGPGGLIAELTGAGVEDWYRQPHRLETVADAIASAVASPGLDDVGEGRSASASASANGDHGPRRRGGG
ncbi:MAG: hypothetical protein K0V04_23870 [Deltaproteobacteria bacterium]|nr:hypothetical protein [Deltaproteobacteria bacterium]